MTSLTSAVFDSAELSTASPTTPSPLPATVAAVPLARLLTVAASPVGAVSGWAMLVIAVVTGGTTGKEVSAGSGGGGTTGPAASAWPAVSRMNARSPVAAAVNLRM
jgi:hypothetical protein